MTLRLDLTEADFQPAVDDDDQAREIFGRKEFVLGNQHRSREDAVFDLLPKVIAAKLRGVIPKDYAVREIQMNFTLGGKVFGVELAGDLTVIFGPEGA